MKFVDDFRRSDLVKKLKAQIEQLSEGRLFKIMEVCGGHTHTIYKHGIEDILPSNIDLVHGPGCPVCVIPMGRLDDAIHIARQPNVIFTTFGDMMRVPGAEGSLLDASAAGADVRLVYSPLDVLKIAREHPDKEVVFFAVGFETTTPPTAMTLLRAQAEGLTNFSIFCNHVLVIPALEALLSNPDLQLDGFIGPGHVSTVIGTEPYQIIANKYRKPLVISGFEPLDILQSVWMLLKQILEGRCEVENQYTRLVNVGGNLVAQDAIAKVFTIRDRFEWRGLGEIARSGLKIRDEYAEFDAEVKFVVPNCQVADAKACQCGEILKGVLKPWQCKVFGTACTPENPIGTCMVSSEGACAAYYKYGRLSALGRKSGAKKSQVSV